MEENIGELMPIHFYPVAFSQRNLLVVESDEISSLDGFLPCLINRSCAVFGNYTYVDNFIVGLNI